MRLWSLEASCLDPKGLVAAWREGLLAQKVLEGGTKGYRSHPQLERFRAGPDGQRLLALFLAEIETEARRSRCRTVETETKKRAAMSSSDSPASISALKARNWSSG